MKVVSGNGGGGMGTGDGGEVGRGQITGRKGCINTC